MTNVDIDNSTKEVWVKGLIVDDELEDLSDCRNFLVGLNLQIPKKYVFFASNYEEALLILQQHSDIKVCFVDVRIPKNDIDSYDYKQDEQPEWGISLLSEIKRINSLIEVRVYSTKVKVSYITEKTIEYSNIKAFYGKDEPIEKKQRIFTEGFRLRSTLKTQYFDYSLFDDDVANFVRTETAKIKKSAQTVIEEIFKIGESLINVKNKLEHGQFLKWLEAELKMSERTAQRLMRVSLRFKSDTVSDLKFLPTALYELSAISTPDEAVAEAIARAKQGETITKKLALSLKDKHKHSKEEETLPTTTKRTRKNKSEPSLSESIAVRETAVSKDRIEDNIRPSPEKPEIIGVIRQQYIWELGKHLLFCGDPNSQDFLKRLPSEISLNLAFPPRKDWLFSYPHQIDSELNFYSKYQGDIDMQLIAEAIKQIIKGTTNEEETVSICYLPYPILLQVVHKLNCRCFIAESDRQKCKAIMTFWENFEQKQSNL